MISATQLRIHPVNWPLANDYRVVGDQLQMRLTDERFGIAYRVAHLDGG